MPTVCILPYLYIDAVPIFAKGGCCLRLANYIARHYADSSSEHCLEYSGHVTTAC